MDVPTTILSILREAECVIVVPPFGGIDRPNLGVHLLQACAAEKGHRIAVFYANLLLASRIGASKYTPICYAPTSALLGERLFTRLAFGHPRFGNNPGWHEQRSFSGKKVYGEDTTYDDICTIESGLREWLDDVVALLVASRAPIVGCTTTFEQTAASIAILRGLKQARPDTLTIIGGANCEGRMANGIASLDASIDHVFSGESEQSFVEFLGGVAAGHRPPGRVIEGKINRALDRLPAPVFTDYYRQLEAYQASRPDPIENIWLPYETSRGCWWGEKSHCTFCGINGQGMEFRQKSASRVMQELKALLREHPNRNICMVDNIMPYRYFSDLLPHLNSELGDLNIFYEQKSNLSLEKISALRSAGIAVIQPGIESLSSPLLKLMKKGVTASQNIELLRYARSIGLFINWNLLYAFPSDKGVWFEHMIELVPALAHLHPPSGLFHLSIDRFSPYFDAHAAFGIAEIRPMTAYAEVFPKTCALDDLAYHFEGTYASESKHNAALMLKLETLVEDWRLQWTDKDNPPSLEIVQVATDSFLLVDTRPIAQQAFTFLDLEQTRALLTGRGTRDIMEWAVAGRYLLELDHKLISLATARESLLAELLAERLDVCA